MTSLRYKNLALNRRRKLLDKEKRERTAKDIREKGRRSEKKRRLALLSEEERYKELYES